MSGPIVRTGTTPEFWKNWDKVFSKKSSKSKSSATAAKKKAGSVKAAKSARKRKG
jgi:hypothetical protein